MSCSGTVIVTGGNAGLGLACARELATRSDSHVILACRDPDRAAAAVDALRRASGDRFEALPLDLASLGSVRRFAELARAGNRPPLRALVCNAGIQKLCAGELTGDGFDVTFQVNHLGHFLLANLLAPAMREGGRVVFVTSTTHDASLTTGMPAPEIDDFARLARGAGLADRPGTAGRRAYTSSKFCNILCAYELARRSPWLRVNAFDPGLLPGTSLARDYGPLMRWAWRWVAPLLTFHPLVSSTRRSGRELARLADDPALDGVTGRHFRIGRERPSAPQTYELERAAALWRASAAWCGL